MADQDVTKTEEEEQTKLLLSNSSARNTASSATHSSNSSSDNSVHDDDGERGLQEEGEGNPTVKVKQKRSLRQWSLFGHACVLASCLLQGFTSVVVKIMTGVDPFLFVCWRAVVMACLAGPCVLWSSRKKKKKRSEKEEKDGALSTKARSVLLLVRGLSMGVAVCTSFYAFRNMPLGDCRMIIASTPVFVGILARVTLSEECGWFHVVTMTMTMVGVAVVMQPPFIFGDDFREEGGGNNSTTALEDASEENATVKHFRVGAVALASAVCQAVGVVATRAMKDVDTFLISLVSSFTAFWFGVAASASIGSPSFPEPGEAAMMTLTGCCAFVGQCLMILSIKVDDAASMSLARKSEDILVALVAQVCYFGDVPGAVTLIGAAIIFACIIASGLRKVLEARNKRNEKEGQAAGDENQSPKS